MLTLWKHFTIPRTVGEAACRAVPGVRQGLLAAHLCAQRLRRSCSIPVTPSLRLLWEGNVAAAGPGAALHWGKRGKSRILARTAGVKWPGQAPGGQFASTLQTQVASAAASAFAGDAFQGWLHPGDGFRRAASKEYHSHGQNKLLLQTGSRVLAVGWSLFGVTGQGPSRLAKPESSLSPHCRAASQGVLWKKPSVNKGNQALLSPCTR